MQKITPDNQLLSEENETVLKSGESFDCVFKLKIGVPPQNFAMEDLRSLMMGSSQGTRSNIIDSSAFSYQNRSLAQQRNTSAIDIL